MKRVRVLLSWFVLAVLLQLFFAGGVALAGGGEPGEGPWSPRRVGRRTMTFQPPGRARQLDEFVPPGLTRTNLAAPPGQKVTTVPVTPNGRVFSFNNQVGVVAEGGTFANNTKLEFTQLAVPTSTVTATQTISTVLRPQTLIRFDIEAIETGNGRAVGRFAGPSRLVVDLRPLMSGLEDEYTDFFLAYRDEENPKVWHEVDITIHQPDGLISAEVNHFSGWAAGTRPARWNPEFNEPAASTFSGAATYSYPIDVPPGRNGLQPAVNLSYSSRGVDGLIHDPNDQAVGTGWSLSEISIARSGVRLMAPCNVPYSYLPEDFRLVMNGSGYRLIQNGSGTGQNGGDRFYVKDQPGWYIERMEINMGSGIQRYYWLILTPDGTHYRLGYAHGSESYQVVNNTWYMQIGGNVCENNTDPVYQAGLAWYVDTVTDPFGNQMTYHYYSRPIGETIRWYDGNNWATFQQTTHTRRLAEIRYNYPDRIGDANLPPSPTLTPLSSTPGTRLEFRATSDIPDQNDPTQGSYIRPISHILVYHGEGTTPVREIRIGSTKLQATSDSGVCPDYDLGGNPPPDIVSTTRVITGVREFVGTDANVGTWDKGYALPATTFEYNENDPYPHYNDQWNNYCFSSST